MGSQLAPVIYTSSVTVGSVAGTTVITTSLPRSEIATFLSAISVAGGVAIGQSQSTSLAASGTATTSAAAAATSISSNNVTSLSTITITPPPAVGTLAICPSGPQDLSCVYVGGTADTYSPVTRTVTTVQSAISAPTPPYVEVSWTLHNVAATSTLASMTSQTTGPSSSVSGAGGASTTSSTSHTGNGLGTPVVAGVAVACLIGGALVTGLIAFFILKKRPRGDRYGSRNTYVPAATPAYGGEKGTPMVSITPVGTMDFLPQQADDAEVKRKLSTAIDQIDQHVENFYGNRSAPIDPSWEGELSRFDTNELPLPLVACFQNSAAPMTLIKHCLAYYVFNLTVSPDEHRTSLLPAEMAGMVAAMYHRTLSSAATKDNITAFSTWKSLTKYLRPDLARDAGTDQKISEGSARIAMHFTNIFSPWANTQYSSDTRARHLTELLNEAVQTAIWLFGQPDNYRFEWDVPNTRQDTNYSAVIVPAVWKTTHSATRLTGKGQNVLAPVIKGF